MLGKTRSVGVFGTDGYPVEVAFEVRSGPPDAAVKESKDRVGTALKNSGYTWPDGRLTINLAPADMKKEGLRSTCPWPSGRGYRSPAITLRCHR